MSSNDGDYTKMRYGPMGVGGKDIYFSLGEGLGPWSLVEGALAHLFSVAVCGDVGHEPALRAFWAVVSFDAKLKMASEAIESSIRDNDELCERWVILKNRIGKKGQSRNKLAHGGAVSLEICSADGAAKQQEVFFVPYLFRDIQVGFFERVNKSIENNTPISVSPRLLRCGLPTLII